MQKFIRAIFFTFFSFLALTLSYGEVINAGDLTWKITPTHSVFIHSQDPQLEILAKKLLNMHGSFTISTQNSSSFIIELHKEDNQSIRLIVRENNSDGAIIKEQIQSTSWKKSTLIACDKVVETILKESSFFTGTLLFVGDRGKGKEIYIGDLAFQNIKQLTHDRSDPVMPRISKDGTKVLYTTYFKSGFPDIYMIDLKSSKRIPIASYDGINNGGAFSPDGQHIAMVLSSSGVPQIYVGNAKGQSPHRLTQIKSLKASPSWRPDSKSIVYVSDELGGPQLFEVFATGGGNRRIKTQISNYCAEPECHPVHKNQLVFTAAVGKSFQIALYAEGEGSRFITQGPEDHVEPFWLSDGRHIICTQRTKSIKKLCVIDTLTGKKTLITPSDFGNTSMACFFKKS